MHKFYFTPKDVEVTMYILPVAQKQKQKNLLRKKPRFPLNKFKKKSNSFKFLINSLNMSQNPIRFCLFLRST